MHADISWRLRGRVTPPDDMMAAARRDLSREGFARLMEKTGGRKPSARELCAEVEFERSGAYPHEETARDPRVDKIERDAVLIATAMHELSTEGYRELMLANDWRAPTPKQLCEAVEAERARAAR